MSVIRFTKVIESSISLILYLYKIQYLYNGSIEMLIKCYEK